MGKRLNVAGEKYGRLTAIKRVESRNKRTMWLFQCECGNQVIKDISKVRIGNTNSCGCIRREQLIERNKKTATHGESNTRLYAIWHSLKERCTTTTHRDYKNYGARGIKVCDEWKNSFESFRDWALANGYDSKAPYMQCTIDRINNDGNYEPNNCRWVDMKVQASNRRKIRKEIQNEI